MKIGLLSDLHLGQSGEGRYHNRQLLGRAEEIASAAVALLNHHDLDLAVALGDISQTGAMSELAIARDILAELTCPWLVLPGNHDRAAMQSGFFDQVFKEHIPQPYLRLDRVGLLFFREETPPDGVMLGSIAIGTAVESVAADLPPLLWLFSHFPITSEEAHAVEQGRLYANHFGDGEHLLGRLREVTETPIAAFSGHQHWHHVRQKQGYTQCTTGALIEYPMECRIVYMDETSLRVTTLETASPDLAAASLDGSEWVRGQDHDRHWELSLVSE